MTRAPARLARVAWARVACALAVSAAAAGAQLDTTALDADAAAVYRTWRAYLDSKAGWYSARAGAPSPYWTEAERRRWPVYDLAGYYLPDRATPQVLAVERDGDGYRVVTRFRSGDAPALTLTVHAVREGDAWRLANALPRHTRAWRRDTVGPITYVFPPAYPYDRARARRAVAFADSVAGAFGVPRLGALTYYLASSIDEVYAILGLASDVKYGPVGGLAQPVNRMLFSGIPALGEEYRHELAHLVLAPLVGARTAYVVSEGVATWLGGTTGTDYPTAVRGLAAFLAERPAVSLDTVVAAALPPTRLYPAAAVLAQMAFERGGVEAVRRLMDGGPGAAELRATLERELGEPWPAIAAGWRARVLRLAGDTSSRPGGGRVPSP